MTPFRFSPLLAATASLLLAGAAAVCAAPTPKKAGFDAYSLLRARNIFDPERQPGMAAATPAPVQRTAPGHTDYAALTGILITTDKTVAFFSGSRPEYSGVLPAGKEIAGARITLILPDAIEIERGGKRTLVAVGQTVPLDANSTPTAAPVTAPAAAAPGSNTPTPSSPNTTSSSQAPSNPAAVNRDEIRRRMMEKRQKELQ